MQEIVYNLGNYEDVLKQIESLGMDDKGAATAIRNIYKYGAAGIPTDLRKAQKQTLIELVELFFGTEGFRSPAAIIETNMALDLVIAGHKKFAGLLTGKETTGKGGELSFSMKSSDKAGGIESGRRLSEDVNQYHSRTHKYGGKPIDRNSAGYKEYLVRKKALTDTWVDKIATTKGTTGSLDEIIQQGSSEWHRM